MPYYVFWWDDDNADHLAQNGVSPDDFEYVVLRASAMELERSDASGRPACRGETFDGRVLFCVWEPIDELNVYPTTAYEIGDEA